MMYLLLIMTFGPLGQPQACDASSPRTTEPKVNPRYLYGMNAHLIQAYRNYEPVRNSDGTEFITALEIRV